MAIGTSTQASAPPLAPPGPFEEMIDDHVRRTQAHVRAVEIAGSLLTLAAVVLGYLLAMALVDHWLFYRGLGTWGRMIAWLGLLAILVGYATRTLLPYCLRRINPVYAAEALERAQPSLKNSLVNFLFLKRHHPGVSEAVYLGLQQQTAAGLAHVPVEAAVDRKRLTRVGYVLIGILAAAAIYLVCSSKNPLRSVARVVAPWADISAATRVQITNVKPVTEAFRGQPITVTAEVRGLRTDEPVLLRYSTADNQIVDQSIQLYRQGDETAHKCQLPADGTGLEQDLTYRLEAGDAVTRTYRVHVIPVPTIQIDSIEYTYPEYTGLAKQTVERLGDIKAIEGTQVVINVTASQPIKTATLELEGLRPQTRTMVSRGGLAARADLTLLLKQVGTRREREFTGYRLVMKNQNGDGNRDPVTYHIEVTPDQPPLVEILEPMQRETKLPADKSVDLQVRARDPDYALSDLRIVGKRGDQPLFDMKLLEHEAQPWSHPFRLTRRFTPAEYGLRPGEVVIFHAVAVDNKSPEPNQAETPEYRIVITDPENPPGKASDGNKSRSTGMKDRQPKSDPSREEHGVGTDEDNQQQASKEPMKGSGTKDQENKDQKQKGSGDEGKSEGGDGNSGGGSSSKSSSGGGSKGNQKDKAGGGSSGSDQSQDGAKGDSSKGQSGQGSKSKSKTSPKDKQSGGSKGAQSGDGSDDPVTSDSEAVSELLKQAQEKSGRKPQGAAGQDQLAQRDSGMEQQPNQEPDKQPQGNNNQNNQDRGNKDQSNQGQSTGNGPQPGQQGSAKSDGSQSGGMKSQPQNGNQSGDATTRQGNQDGSQQQNQPPGNQSNGGQNTAGAQSRMRSQGMGQQQDGGAKQDGAKQDGAKQDGAKQDSAKQDSAKQDGATQDISKQDGSKQDGAKQDGAKQDGAKSDGMTPSQNQTGGMKSGSEQPGNNSSSNKGPGDKQPGTKPQGGMEPGDKSNGAQASADKKSSADNKSGDSKGMQPQQNPAGGMRQDGMSGLGMSHDNKTGGNQPNAQAPKQTPNDNSSRQPPQDGMKSADSKSDAANAMNQPNQRDSDTKGESGDRNGQGAKGNGQSGAGAGQGNSGGSQSPSDAGKPSQQAGPGDMSNRAGGQQKTDQATGQSSHDQGKAAQGTPDPTQNPKTDRQPENNLPQTPGMQPPGMQGMQPTQPPHDGGQPGNRQADMGQPSSAGKPTGRPGNAPGVGADQADRRSSPPPGNNPDGRAPQGDAPNLRYSRAATDLATEYLQDQLAKGKIDPDLKRRFGWKDEEQFRALARRLEAMRDRGTRPGATKADRKAYDEWLQSLGLHAGSGPIKTTRAVQQRLDHQREDVQVTSPREMRELFPAFQRGVSKHKEASE